MHALRRGKLHVKGFTAQLQSGSQMKKNSNPYKNKFNSCSHVPASPARQESVLDIQLQLVELHLGLVHMVTYCWSNSRLKIPSWKINILDKKIVPCTFLLCEDETASPGKCSGGNEGSHLPPYKVVYDRAEAKLAHGLCPGRGDPSAASREVPVLWA